MTQQQPLRLARPLLVGFLFVSSVGQLGLCADLGRPQPTTTAGDGWRLRRRRRGGLACSSRRRRDSSSALKSAAVSSNSPSSTSCSVRSGPAPDGLRSAPAWLVEGDVVCASRHANTAALRGAKVSKPRELRSFVLASSATASRHAARATGPIAWAGGDAGHDPRQGTGESAFVGLGRRDLTLGVVLACPFAILDSRFRP